MSHQSPQAGSLAPFDLDMVMSLVNAMTESVRPANPRTAEYLAAVVTLLVMALEDAPEQARPLFIEPICASAQQVNVMPFGLAMVAMLDLAPSVLGQSAGKPS